jgi:hypothetical protein
VIRVNTSKFNLREAANRQLAALGLYAHTAAKKMEASAKTDAPWTDRTTNARQSIAGDHFWRGSSLVVRLSGGMEYSVYLELAHEKRYATLQPTIARYASEILAGYQKLVKD